MRGSVAPTLSAVQRGKEIRFHLRRIQQGLHPVEVILHRSAAPLITRAVRSLDGITDGLFGIGYDNAVFVEVSSDQRVAQ